MGSPRRRDLLLKIPEETRQRYGLAVVGYVAMPEHFHLLIGEPEKATPSIVMQVLKQRFARQVLAEIFRRRDPRQPSLWPESEHVWQRL